MNYRAIKVCISIDNNVENFYIKFDIKHSRFYHLQQSVFNRNPSVNSPNLKVYWIDADNDEILISCDEDFVVYLEEGKGRKLYFSVNTKAQQNEPQEESIPMESDNVQIPNDRKCKKGHKDDEKRCRRVEKLSKKLRHYEEACKNEEERTRSKHHPEKREVKNNERLERARRRVEQIRTIISSIDPANLNSSNAANNVNSVPSTSSNDVSQPAELPFSPETVRLLSSAIANCLQPCTLINKVLNEVYAIIPQVMENANDVINNVDQQDQQQQTEVPKNTTATNTSNANTPLLDRNSNQEIEELFKEAAKELEKMNEIVNNNKMESSTTSSSLTGVTQIERVFKNINDSAMSDATVIDMNSARSSSDQLDSAMPEKSIDDEFYRVGTPPKSMRSRESSIEVHDVSSVMSDDSRDWTLLSQDELSIEPVPVQRNVDPKSGAIPKNSSQALIDAEIQTNEEKNDSIKSISIETQTPASLLSGINQQQLQASVQKSIDIVQKSIESIHKSMETNIQKPEIAPVEQPKPVAVEQPKSVAVEQPKPVAIEQPKPVAIEQPKPVPEVNMRRDIYPNLQPTAPVIPSQANLNASRSSQIKPQQHFEPAVVVYDPNPKINAAVHTMMNMGFSNEDNWLTQLLLNVDGDVAKAINFLTPQPKNRKQ
ncbi:putative leucine-rich repeat-containing protein DDB_G0290503 isoform X2 [Chironomus tepperi]|uniref:putative leucine-rich repeat-containing protein DDB_G0290503 isoform X2 n=1 Tax=Chironomus tepperi TaxID=113505 RepID=UPI00391EEE39